MTETLPFYDCVAEKHRRCKTSSKARLTRINIAIRSGKSLSHRFARSRDDFLRAEILLTRRR